MTVEEKQKQDELTRKRPLWDIADSRIEIETIAENAAKHIDEAYPKMRTSQVYMAIPRISQVFVVHLLNYLDNLKRSDIEKCKESGVEFSLGDIATFRIEYLSTPNSEGKESTFNPAILVGPELDYNKRDIPYKDALSVEMAEKARGLGARYILAQYYDQMSDLKPICEAAMKELAIIGKLTFYTVVFIQCDSCNCCESTHYSCDFFIGGDQCGPRYFS